MEGKMKIKRSINIVINQQSYLKSLAKDLTSLGLLGFLCWFNHNFIGGSYFVNFLIFLVILAYLATPLKDVSFYKIDLEKLNKIKKILDDK